MKGGDYMKKLYPLLVTAKLKESADFYVKYFGFSVTFEQDWYVQLVHKHNGIELAFMIPNAENQPKELHPAFNGKGMIYSFEVKDAKSEYKRFSGIKKVVELTDEAWGQRHFIIQDPAGIFVDVVQQLDINFTA